MSDQEPGPESPLPAGSVKLAIWPRQASVLLVAVLATACGRFGRSTFTGAFIVDERPRGMTYLALTQTGSTVSGYMNFVKPDDQGGTQSQTLAVQGMADGDSVTLTTKPFLNLGSLTLVGRRDGKDLLLTYPSRSGAVGKGTFKRTSEEEFNRRLGEWRGGLSKAYQKREQARREQDARQAEVLLVQEAEARQAAEKAAQRNAVENAAAALAATGTRLIEAASNLAAATRFDNTRKGYTRYSEALHTHYVQLQRDGSEVPLRCNQLGVVRAGLAAMRSDFFDMRSVGSALRSTKGQVISQTRRVEQELGSIRHYLEMLKAAAMADTSGLLREDSMRPMETETAKIIGAGEKQLAASKEALQNAETQATDTTAKAVQLLKDAEEFVAGLRCSR